MADILEPTHLADILDLMLDSLLPAYFSKSIDLVNHAKLYTLHATGNVMINPGNMHSMLCHIESSIGL